MKLNLDDNELRALVAVLISVSGHPRKTERKFIDSILSKIEKQGEDPDGNKYEDYLDLNLRGEIVFVQPKNKDKS